MSEQLGMNKREALKSLFRRLHDGASPKEIEEKFKEVIKDGDYLGCLEVTQDITEIKKVEGEKRLLDT